jgi:tripartite-type tricarboxylate transporter receptor subunit TctC
MSTKRTVSSLGVAVALAISLAGGATAQTYPAQPIKLIVPLGAGGTPDVIARLVAQWLSPQLGQPVVVENRPGAGATLGLKAVATAEPNGYTLLVGSTSSLAINPTLYQKLDYAPAKDLVPVAMWATIPNVLVVDASVPANTLAELVAYSKANPGKLHHGSTLGTPPHLLGEFVRAKTGADLTYVPYKGRGSAMADLLGGNIQVTADSLATLVPYFEQGKIKPLAVTSAARLPELPNVPTLAEAGLHGYPPDTWMGVAAPAGTPESIVHTLNTAINAILAAAETKQSLAKLGFTPSVGSPHDFAERIALDRLTWSAVVKLTAVKVD